MRPVELIHEHFVFDRRVQILARHLAAMMPQGARVLDVGCGDGSLAKLLMQRRPDVSLKGIDVLIRPECHIPVEPFDGARIPHEAGAFDVVMFVDVLHHTPDPAVLLAEAARVAGRAVLIKDHLADGLLAVPTLRFMDQVGNRRHSVVLPYNYWPRARWDEAFRGLGLGVEEWRQRLGLYPWPADLVFGRSLHFIARLGRSAAGAAA